MPAKLRADALCLRCNRPITMTTRTWKPLDRTCEVEFTHKDKMEECRVSLTYDHAEKLAALGEL